MGAHEEQVVLTATGATTTQTSDPFVIPSSADTMLLYMDVTAGSTLVLDYELQMHLPGPDEWIVLATDLPSAGGITGVSITNEFFAPVASSLLWNPSPIRGRMRVVVLHGNATACTYKVYVQPS